MIAIKLQAHFHTILSTHRVLPKSYNILHRPLMTNSHIRQHTLMAEAITALLSPFETNLISFINFRCIINFCTTVTTKIKLQKYMVPSLVSGRWYILFK
jgi:hypothetical protein